MRRQSHASASNSKAKPKIGLEIRKRLKAGGGEIKSAAEKLRLEYQRLRQDIYQNRFLEADLLKLCREVNLPTDLNGLHSAYDFTLREDSRGLRRQKAELWTTKTPSLLQIFSYVELRQAKMSRIQPQAREDISGLFRGLGRPDSLFLTITDDFPLHWGDEATTMPHIAESIERGVTICYLHPNEALYAQLRRVEGMSFCSPEEVKRRFAEFNKSIENYTRPEFRGIIPQRTRCIEFSWPVFCTPFTRYALYLRSPTDGGRPRSWATITLPWSRDWNSAGGEASYAIFEVPEQSRQFLHKFCGHFVVDALRGACEAGKTDATLESLRSQLFWRPGTVSAEATK